MARRVLPGVSPGFHEAIADSEPAVESDRTVDENSRVRSQCVGVDDPTVTRIDYELHIQTEECGVAAVTVLY